MPNSTNNSTSYVYAARTIAFEQEGLYDFSFDWRCKGESNYDLLRAFLVPASVRLEAGGNAYGMNTSSNTTPQGWIDLANGKLNQQDDWQHFSASHTVAAGTYQLVFFWKNDNSVGYQRPAAVDNISVRRNTTVSSYPYYCDFSDPEENECWELINGNRNRWVIGTEVPYHTDGALYITDGTNGYQYDTYDESYVYAARRIHLDGGEYTFQFWWRCNGERDIYAHRDFLRAFLVPESITLTAGYNDDIMSVTIPEGWFALDNGPLQGNNYGEYLQTSCTVPAGNYRLVFYWENDENGGNQYPAAVDDVRIVPVEEIVDATPYTRTMSREGCDLAYGREISLAQDVWVPFFVPFTATVDQWTDVFGFTFAELVDVTTETVNGTVADVLHWRVMDYPDTLFAGHPYIMRNDEGCNLGGFSLAFYNVTLAPCTDTTVVSFSNGEMGANERVYSLIGVYDTLRYGDPGSPSRWYAMGGGNFWPATEGNALLPQRFLMTITLPSTGEYCPAPQGGAIIRVGGDNVGIIEATPDPIRPEDPNWYDILGRRVAQPQKGHIYFHNGQKILY